MASAPSAFATLKRPGSRVRSSSSGDAELELAGAVVRGRSQREGDGGGEVGGQPLPVGVVDVDDADARISLEQSALGREVVLHVGVEVEVVLREVGEERRREVRAVDAMERKRMRGDLHRAGPIAAVEHRPEGGLEVDRLRRGVDHRMLAPADHRLDSPEQPAALAGGFEQRREQEDRRRLAVGAGDPDDAERRAGVAVEADRERRHRRADRGDHELGDAEAERALDDERDGAGGHRLGSMVVAV